MVHDVDGSSESFNPEVWFSGSFAAGGTAVYVYGGPGLNAGLAVVDSASPGFNNFGAMPWFDLEGLLGIDGMDAIKDALEGGDPAISGFATTGTWAWMITGKSTTQLGEKFQDLDPDVMIEAVLDGRTEPIYSVAGADGRGYAGTESGLFTGVVLSDGKVNTFASTGKNSLTTLIDGTRDLSFTQLSAYKSGTTVYAAAYTPSSEELFILKGDTVIESFPVFAGLPQGELKFAWWVEGTTLKLAIAGDDATVTYNVATVANND
jgi:hypothetical protein